MQIKEPFCTELRDQCLIKSIPDNVEEMQRTTLLNDLLDFIAFIDQKHFTTQDDVGKAILVEFSEKINYHFQNKFCTNIENIAVEIMKKDLHDMVLVGDSDSLPSNSIFRVILLASYEKIHNG
jgi:hypothetical protein